MNCLPKRQQQQQHPPPPPPSIIMQLTSSSHLHSHSLSSSSSSSSSSLARHHKVIMYNFIVILLLLNVQVVTLSALCNKTTQDRQIRSSSNNNSNNNNLTSADSYNHYSNSSLMHLDPTSTTTTTANFTSHRAANSGQLADTTSLDELRLEYYKYKIVSHLSLNTDPDKHEPNIDHYSERSLELSRNLVKSSSPVSNSRQKRSLSCSEVKSDKNACCLETFYVNFTEIGWDKWILYPTGYNANYCRGQCDLSHARYYHSTLLSKFSSVIGLCCSPRQMAPLRLLYIDENNKVLQKTVPDMIVESCDCA